MYVYKINEMLERETFYFACLIDFDAIITLWAWKEKCRARIHNSNMEHMWT